MKQEWFVFRDGHHKGPYSCKQVSLMFDKKELDFESNIWREGLDGWLPLKDVLLEVSDFTGFFPPAFPGLPELPDLPEDLKLESINPNESFLLPELPESSDVGEVSSVKEIDTSKDDWSDVEGNTEKENGKNLFLKVTMGWFVFVIALSTMTILVQSFKTSPHFKGVAKNDFEKMLILAKGGKASRSRVYLALTRNGNELVMGSGFGNEAKVYLTLQSMDGRVLSGQKISITSESMLSNHAAYFKRMKLLSGRGMVRGEYLVYGKIVPNGPFAKLAHFLLNFDSFKANSKLIDWSHPIHFRKNFILYPGEIVNFEKDLKKYNINELKKITGPLETLLQKYETLSSLLDKAKGSYLGILKKIQRGRGIVAFERKFATTVSPVMQRIILDTNEEYEKSTGKSLIIVKHLEKVLNFGKSLGILASDMIVETGKIHIFNNKKRKNLRLIFGKRIKNLEDIANIRIQKLKVEIDNIQGR